MLAVVGACASAPAHRAGTERLARIDFEGNHRLSNSTLVTGLALHRTLKRGSAPDPYSIDIDADRIRGEYLRKGFLDVDVRSRVERKGDDTTVTYTVEEGVRAKTRISVHGLSSDVPVDKILAMLPLKDGQPFDYDAYDLAKPNMLGVVQDAGYAHASLESSVIADRANHTAVIDLAYVTGPKCTFGQVKIIGATGELAEAVSNRITFQAGQQYSQAAVAQTQRNLYGFGRFSTVRVQPDKTGRAEVGVEVAVSESARHEVKLGGGLGIDPTAYEVRGRAGYSIAGWPFPLDTVTLDLRPAYALLRDGSGAYEPRIRALAKLERKDLFWTFTTSDIQAGYNYLTVEAYTDYGPLASVGFETPVLTDKLRVRGGWGIQQVSFSHPNSSLPVLLQEQIGIRKPNTPMDQFVSNDQRIAAFQQSIVLDLRDHPIEPKLGAYAELKIAEGTKYAGSELTYLEVVPDVRGYVPMPWGAVLAMHGRFGGIFGDIPTTERFFGGGSISQRGFGERKLAPSHIGPPLDAQGVPVENGAPVSVPYGGAGLLDTSVEARIPITTIKDMPLGGVVFLDGGDVTERPGDLDVSNLHWALGLGVRLQTIVGPVRLDFGYRLNRTGGDNPDPDSHFAYHLTIGEAF
ncbi:MAG: BamA/TamA family outer membrane protein [Kofleriaceae bacterium]